MQRLKTVAPSTSWLLSIWPAGHKAAATFCGCRGEHMIHICMNKLSFPRVVHACLLSSNWLVAKQSWTKLSNQKPQMPTSVAATLRVSNINSMYLLFIPTSGIFNPPGSALSVKASQSFSTKKSSNEGPPPVPPPFPTDILKTGKERVVFL